LPAAVGATGPGGGTITSASEQCVISPNKRIPAATLQKIAEVHTSSALAVSSPPTSRRLESRMPGQHPACDVTAATLRVLHHVVSDRLRQWLDEGQLSAYPSLRP
jgi:hypothetical protein